MASTLCSVCTEDLRRLYEFFRGKRVSSSEKCGLRARKHGQNCMAGKRDTKNFGGAVTRLIDCGRFPSLLRTNGHRHSSSRNCMLRILHHDIMWMREQSISLHFYLQLASLRKVCNGNAQNLLSPAGGATHRSQKRRARGYHV